VKTDFLGIKNENWQAASRDLGAHGLRLYLYLASNANNYNLALSPAAARAAVGIPRSTYFDQFAVMVDKGYLVPGAGNIYDFYEVPQPATRTQKEMTADGLEFEESPSHGTQGGCGGHTVSPENIEINNMTDTPNNTGINNGLTSGEGVIQKPQIKEIVISRPVAEGKSRPKPIEQLQKAEFVF
jgi:hypothetical protein